MFDGGCGRYGRRLGNCSHKAIFDRFETTTKGVIVIVVAHLFSLPSAFVMIWTSSVDKR